MRSIGTIQSESEAKRFSAALLRQGIEIRCEAGLDPATGKMAYQVWALDEDRLDEARSFLQRFQIHPADPIFNVPLSLPQQQQEEEPQEMEEIPLRRRMSSPLTLFFLALCCFVFLLDKMEEEPLLLEGLSDQTFLLTPIQAAMLYDLPEPAEQLEQYLQQQRIPAGQKIQEMRPETRAELEAFVQAPYWRGFYEWVLLKIKKGDTQEAAGPLFVKIREGELWRLFTPCLLHGNLLHILFNMLWLWVLGRPIEQRIGIGRTLLLTLLFGIVPNTIQYLMSGPFFIGYSGVVMGLAGFIWMRERIAPWEGYPLPRTTILFLGIFVFSMVLLQMISFFVQLFSNLPFILNIANAAHIAGALLGALLGRLSFFAWRVQ